MNPLQSVLSKMHWAKNEINSSRFMQKKKKRREEDEKVSIHCIHCASSLYSQSMHNLHNKYSRKEIVIERIGYATPSSIVYFLAGKKNLHENSVIGTRLIKRLFHFGSVSFLWHDRNNCTFAQPHSSILSNARYCIIWFRCHLFCRWPFLQCCMFKLRLVLPVHFFCMLIGRRVSIFHKCSKRNWF